MPEPTILVLGTCDTKLDETLYISSRILSHPHFACATQIMDVGRYPRPHPSITHGAAALLSSYHARTSAAPPRDYSALSRAAYTALVSRAATEAVRALHGRGSIHGIVGAGGSSGTAIIAAAMRDGLPVGFPKLLVSTMASGDTRPYVDGADIALLYSVTDVAGLNFLSRRILANAAGAVAGMVAAARHLDLELELELQREDGDAAGDAVPGQQGDGHSEGGEGGGGEAEAKAKAKAKAKPVRVGMTMFGLTTPCVDRVRAVLTSAAHERATGRTYEPLVFHATGSGGRAMERLVDAGLLDAVVDLTTSEVTDEVVGGVLSAGPTRMDAPVRRRGMPYLVSLGACEMVNFGPRATVPERWGREDSGRRLFVHNEAVTLMRTDADEARRVG
ncbi:MAG: hypothetical protein LQ340_008096, partial [Diploschistes diacapsis]